MKFSECTNKVNIDDLYRIIKGHLENLSAEIKKYFHAGEEEKIFALANNPFTMNVSDAPQDPLEKLIEMINSFDAKQSLQHFQLINSGLNVKTTI